MGQPFLHPRAPPIAAKITNIYYDEEREMQLVTEVKVCQTC